MDTKILLENGTNELEVLEFKLDGNAYGINVAKIKEIINYKRAMVYAVELLKEKPFIHLNMIKDIHSVLLSGVRGENKAGQRSCM